MRPSKPEAVIDELNIIISKIETVYWEAREHNRMIHSGAIGDILNLEDKNAPEK